MSTISNKYSNFCLQLSLLTIIYFVVISQTSCKKYLDKKPKKSELVPSSLDHLLDLLNNQKANNNSPGLLELVSDNYFISDAEWQLRISAGVPAFTALAQNYTWDSQATPFDESWITPYQGAVYTANFVLDYLPIVTVNIGEQEKYNYIKGAALFYRAYVFQQLAQLYCKPYNSATANSDAGIIIRTTSNINIPSKRSSIQETYDAIINNLEDAASLLPVSTTFPTQPTRAAAYGALARTFLCMRIYDSAGTYADKALQINNTLIDYNSASVPFQTFNAEVIYHSTPISPLILLAAAAKIDSSLYSSYALDDLRKGLFFKPNTGTATGTYRFQGSYNGNISAGSRVFDGIATDELYLIRAECYAKSGNASAAFADLNTLMQKRWKSTTWAPFRVTTAKDALQTIRTERRKELVFRGQRWSDIRRYNLEDSSITLKRIINGVTYSLPPNDIRFVMLIPWDVVNRSGIEQNPR